MRFPVRSETGRLPVGVKSHGSRRDTGTIIAPLGDWRSRLASPGQSGPAAAFREAASVSKASANDANWRASSVTATPMRTTAALADTLTQMDEMDTMDGRNGGSQRCVQACGGATAHRARRFLSPGRPPRRPNCITGPHESSRHSQSSAGHPWRARQAG